jgi:hypothetical protein
MPMNIIRKMGPGLAFFVVLFLCFILDFIFFPVICSFKGVSGWKLRKIVRDLPQAQKGSSYLYPEFGQNTTVPVFFIQQLPKKEVFGIFCIKGEILWLK